MAASDELGYDRRVNAGRFDFAGLTALVTGATSGIGLGIAEALEQSGCSVLRHGVESDAPEGVLIHDLSRRGSGAALADAALRSAEVDILVHCASVQRRARWSETDEESFADQLQTNLLSSFELIRRIAGPMADRGWGRILTIGSVQQSTPHPDMVPYAASKSALSNVVRNLAKQFAPRGVTVNNLAPGVIETPRNEAALADADYSRRIVAGIPAGHVGSVADCVAPALLLCSREAGYITGQDLYVDGGMSL